MKRHPKQRGIVLLPTDFSAEWIDWMAQAGLNVLKLHMLQKENDLLPFLASRKGQDVLRRARDAGMDIEYEIHAFSLLLPRSLFDTSPYLFRMDIRGNCTPDCNFCPSSKEALRIAQENVLKLMETMRPTTHRYYLWPDDGGAWCHCPACAGLSDSDQNVLVMNALAEALRSVDSEAQLACLAYGRTLSPPALVEPGAGLFLEWAPIHRCYRHAIDDPGCAANRSHASGLSDLLEVFDPASAQVLEYWMDASLFSRWKRPAVRLPFDQALMQRDVDFYRSLGMGSATSFASFLDAEYVALYGKPPVREYADVLRTFG